MLLDFDQGVMRRLQLLLPYRTRILLVCTIRDFSLQGLPLDLALSRKHAVRDVKVGTALVSMRARLNQQLPALIVSLCCELTFTGNPTLPQLQYFSALRQLELVGSGFKLPDLTLLSHLPLRKLTTRNTSLGSLRGLRNCTKLRYLDVSYCLRLSDLTPVRIMKHLVMLDIEGCSAIRGLAPLEGCGMLRDLNCSKMKLDELTPQVLPSGLERLRADNCILTGRVEISEQLQLVSLRMRNVRFVHPSVVSQFQVLLHTCPALAIAELSTHQLELVCAHPQARLERLVCHTRSNLPTDHVVGSLPALSYLSLSGNFPLMIFRIPAAGSLTELRLDRCGMENLHAIGSCTALRLFTAKDCRRLKTMSGLPFSKLRHLDLTNTTQLSKFELSWVRALACDEGLGCESGLLPLQILVLDGSGVDTFQRNSWSLMGNLMELSAARVPGFSNLSLFTSLRKLRSLVLKGTNLKHLYPGLSTLGPDLELLDFRNTKLCDSALRRVLLLRDIDSLRVQEIEARKAIFTQTRAPAESCCSLDRNSSAAWCAS